MVDTMYKEQIMELYSQKQNFGELKNKTHSVKHNNKPSCTDEINLDLKIKNGKITDAKFSGKTCFISTVSASVLTENIKGLTLEKARKLTKKDIDKFLGINIIPIRIKCELLALEALQKIK